MHFPAWWPAIIVCLVLFRSVVLKWQTAIASQQSATHCQVLSWWSFGVCVRIIFNFIRISSANSQKLFVVMMYVVQFCLNSLGICTWVDVIKCFTYYLEVQVLYIPAWMVGYVPGGAWTVTKPSNTQLKVEQLCWCNQPSTTQPKRHITDNFTK